MITVENLTLVILGLKQYVLSWDIIGEPDENTITIQRSDALTSEFEDIASINDDQDSYTDTKPLSYRKYIPFYYRIRNPDGSFSKTVNLPIKPDKYVLQQNRMLDRYLKRDIGMKSYYFHHKRYGSFCDCYNHELKKSVIKDCKICFGTGRIKGYADPVEVYISFPQDTPNEINVGHTKYQVLVPQAWTGNSPLIFPEDVIIRDFDKEVFIVNGEVRRTGRRMYPSRQFLSLRAIERGAVEFDLIENIS